VNVCIIFAFAVTLTVSSKYDVTLAIDYRGSGVMKAGTDT
jgi:hypothetical protein